jgi:hypothetical protein
VSPTSPTFVALNLQLNKAHGRIRELEARETDLLTRNRILCAVIASIALHRWESDGGALTPAAPSRIALS